MKAVDAFQCVFDANMEQVSTLFVWCMHICVQTVDTDKEYIAMVTQA